jgi:hypothetical protein
MSCGPLVGVVCRAVVHGMRVDVAVVIFVAVVEVGRDINSLVWLTLATP